MKEPVIFSQTDHWALVNKPHNMPTAPLVLNEPGTLLTWFLNTVPEAVQVIGRKPIEHGLIHRLDTSTQGLVLIAKTPEAYAFFTKSQKKSQIKKYYRAFCAGESTIVSTNYLRSQDAIPQQIISKFRAFGPGRREVRPVFPSDRLYKDAGTVYTTVIESIDHNNSDTIPTTIFNCSLTLGYRHQVRVHLASLGYPIVGDRLYNKDYVSLSLQLYAFGINFIDPISLLPVTFSLPQPDKMNQ